MQAPVSSHLRALLANYIAGSPYELHTAIMPDTPDQVIVITDSAGQAPNPRWLLDFPGAQVRIRGSASDYVGTNLVAHDVKDVLLGIDSQDVGGDRIVSVTALSDVGFLGRDERMRPEFVFNLALIVEPAVTAETNRLAL